ncbi:nodulation protein NfeD [Noviherbaspirillum cavernae]|uniref:Nodulation protein NfeD n=1 Tax=Noviherbaspirillum cavernae TaxID=2320862 RepID=A0A418X674_9BURK|nr:nodulation protein NfeD [Noviherbaspirillum cavernae]RJG07939.1 nodulation protein NfeD [Noviherbaspirillum cavernae]
MNGSFIRRIAVILGFAALCCSVHAAPAPVVILTLDGAVAPASADYINRGITRAARDGAQLVVLMVDTPGGLDTSMRSIIKTILASPVPVAAFVAPSGARAASAGTYILYASHIAAMAPGTNLGAATPVQIGGSPEPAAPDKPATGKKDEKNDKNDKSKKPDEGKPPETLTGQPMTRKQVNDAAAYIRGLAQMRGRNMEWAEKAVREAVSLSSEDALQQHVVDYVATDLANLLQQLDGKKVNVQGQDRTLQTSAAPQIRYAPDWRVRFLAVITDPGIALILLAIGVYGLLFEFMTPGMVLPGVLGGICLLLALYALQLLPVNYAGLALIVLGLAFMIGEAFFPSFGTLGLGGIIAFVFGAVILIDTELPGFGIPFALIVSIAALNALLIAAIVTVAAKTHRRKVVIGEREMIGMVAEVLDDTAWARVRGEIWRVVSKTPLQSAQKVKVLSRNGLVLEVAPLGNHDKGE